MMAQLQSEDAKTPRQPALDITASIDTAAPAATLAARDPSRCLFAMCAEVKALSCGYHGVLRPSVSPEPGGRPRELRDHLADVAARYTARKAVAYRPAAADYCSDANNSCRFSPGGGAIERDAVSPGASNRAVDEGAHRQDRPCRTPFASPVGSGQYRTTADGPIHKHHGLLPMAADFAATRSNDNMVGRIDDDAAIPTEDIRGVVRYRQHAPAVSTAPAKMQPAAAPRKSVGEKGVGRISRAAVEAWEAAETWAWTMAAVTGKVAHDGVGVHVSSRTQNGVNGERGRAAEVQRARKTARPRIVGGKAGRRQHHGYDCCCSRLSGGCLNDGVCRSAIHKRDSILYTSSRNSVVGERVKCCDRVDEVPLRLASLKPNDSAQAPEVPRAPWSEGSLEDCRVVRVFREDHDAMVAVGAAAAVVLLRIERGEQAWRKRSLRVAMIKFRDNRGRACRWREREAEAARVCDKVRVVRGLRGMEVWLRRARGGDEASVIAAAAAAAAAATVAAAAAVADSFVRKRRIRRLMSMLRRNWKTRTALRMRNDFADLHFATWRVPKTVRMWIKRAQTQRKFRNSASCAASVWRSTALPAALTRWVGRSLGDQARRRKLLAWQAAALVPPRRQPNAAELGANTSEEDRFHRAGVRRNRDGEEAQNRNVPPVTCLSPSWPPVPLFPVGEELRARTAWMVGGPGGGQARQAGEIGVVATLGSSAGRLQLGEEWDADEHEAESGEIAGMVADGAGHGAVSLSSGMRLAMAVSPAAARFALAALEENVASEDVGAEEQANRATMHVGGVVQGGVTKNSPREASADVTGTSPFHEGGQLESGRREEAAAYCTVDGEKGSCAACNFGEECEPPIDKKKHGEDTTLAAPFDACDSASGVEVSPVNQPVPATDAVDQRRPYLADETSVMEQVPIDLGKSYKSSATSHEVPVEEQAGSTSPPAADSPRSCRSGQFATSRAPLVPGFLLKGGTDSCVTLHPATTVETTVTARAVSDNIVAGSAKGASSEPRFVFDANGVPRGGTACGAPSSPTSAIRYRAAGGATVESLSTTPSPSQVAETSSRSQQCSISTELGSPRERDDVVKHLAIAVDGEHPDEVATRGSGGIETGDLDGDEAGTPSPPAFVPQGQGVFNLHVGEIRTGHAVSDRPGPLRAGEECEVRRSESTGMAESEQRTASETEQSEADSMRCFAAGLASLLPVPASRGGGRDVNVAVEVFRIDGVLEHVGPLPPAGYPFDETSAEEIRSPLSQRMTDGGASAVPPVVDSVEVVPAATEEGETSDRSRESFTMWEPETRQPGVRLAAEQSPISSDHEPRPTDVEVGAATIHSVSPREIAVTIRGVPRQPRQKLPVGNTSGTLSDDGEIGETSSHPSEEGIALSLSEQTPSSDLSSISWAERGDVATNSTQLSYRRTEESPAERCHEGDPGLSPTGVPQLVTPTALPLLSPTACAVVTRRDSGSRSSCRELDKCIAPPHVPCTSPSPSPRALGDAVSDGAESLQEVVPARRELDAAPYPAEHRNGCSHAVQESPSVRLPLHQTENVGSTGSGCSDVGCEKQMRHRRSPSSEEGPDPGRMRHGFNDATNAQPGLRQAALSAERWRSSRDVVEFLEHADPLAPATTAMAQRVDRAQPAVDGCGLFRAPVLGLLPPSGRIKNEGFGGYDGGDGGDGGRTLEEIGSPEYPDTTRGGTGAYDNVDRETKQRPTMEGRGSTESPLAAAAGVLRPASHLGADAFADQAAGSLSSSSPQITPLPESTSSSSSRRAGTARDSHKEGESPSEAKILTARGGGVFHPYRLRFLDDDAAPSTLRADLSPSAAGSRRPGLSVTENRSCSDREARGAGGGTAGGETERDGGGRTLGECVGGKKKLERSVSASVSMAWSGRRRCGSRGSLEERVSETFYRRRLLEIGLKKWHLRFVAETARRHSALDLAARASTFAMRMALSNWRSGHAALLARQTATAARQSRLHAMPQLRVSTSVLMYTSVAMVAFRYWRRRAAAGILLSSAFRAWRKRARDSCAVESHRRCALARTGLSAWLLATRETGQARTRAANVALRMLRASGGRRLRAWLERRRRRTDAIRVAEKHTSLAGGASTLQERQRRWRKEVLRLRKPLRAWVVTVRERAWSLAARRALVVRAQSKLRVRAMQAWRLFALERRRRRCLSGRGDGHNDRRLVRGGLGHLFCGLASGRAGRDAIFAGEVHWRRRGAALLTGRLKDAARSRRRTFRRADALRARVTARSGLSRWRQATLNRRAALRARRKGEGWLLKKMGNACLAAMADAAAHRRTQDRLTRTGLQHLSCHRIKIATASWRVWAGRQAAGAELFAAAAALHKAWMASAGLQGLDRVARARTERRQAAEVGKHHLLRTSGLERWRAATAARRQSRGQKRIATVHWATALSSKILVSWEAAAVQQWAGTRQQEAAAQHERRKKVERALRAWTAFTERSRRVNDHG